MERRALLPDDREPRSGDVPVDEEPQPLRQSAPRPSAHDTTDPIVEECGPSRLTQIKRWTPEPVAATRFLGLQDAETRLILFQHQPPLLGEDDEEPIEEEEEEEDDRELVDAAVRQETHRPADQTSVVFSDERAYQAHRKRVAAEDDGAVVDFFTRDGSDLDTPQMEDALQHAHGDNVESRKRKGKKRKRPCKHRRRHRDGDDPEHDSDVDGLDSASALAAAVAAKQSRSRAPQQQQQQQQPSSGGVMVAATANTLNVEKRQPVWGQNATGHDLALNSDSANGIILSVRNAGRWVPCEICADKRLCEALGAIIPTGVVENCLEFVRKKRPELATETVLRRHLEHAPMSAHVKDKYMVQTLLTQSFSMAYNLGADYAMEVVTKHGPLKVPNRFNISGFSLASRTFLQLLRAKQDLLKNDYANKTAAALEDARGAGGVDDPGYDSASVQGSALSISELP